MECAFGVLKNPSLYPHKLYVENNIVWEITFLVAEPLDLQDVVSQNYRFRV